MRDIGIRPLVTALFGAALSLPAVPHAQATARPGFVEHFAARAVGVHGSGDGGRIDIYIERWSSDEEVEDLRAPLADRAGSGLLGVLQNQRRRAGVVLMPGVQGLGARARTRTPRQVLFARAVTTPAGRQVVLASDQHLGLGELPRDVRQPVVEFNLLDIRFAASGIGVGKVAGAGDVAYTPGTKNLEIQDYATQPARLVDVRSAKS
jgi:hypothetical protein